MTQEQLAGLAEVPRFSWRDPRAAGYFRAHGFVIVFDALGAPELNEVEEAWDEVVREGAETAGLLPAVFIERFPQNRDLWRKNAKFDHLLRTTRQAEIAMAFLGVSGVRLFHDHAICKPSGRSGTIPWHQDSAYWPLDRVGGSLWSPTSDCSLDGGCLKVLDGSHLDGPGVPRDFLAPMTDDLDADPRLVCLPVNRGETVVLHGLTWHSSDPNRSTRDRLAYLTLWVPATARFVPDHAAWHPTTAHIRVAPGERLEGDWFPLFGEVATDDEGHQVTFPGQHATTGASMFTAGQDIARHVAWLLGRQPAPGQNAARLLSGMEQRVACIKAALGYELISPAQESELATLLDELVLQEVTRTQSVARDVYLRTVQKWWALVGSAIQQRVLGD